MSRFWLQVFTILASLLSGCTGLLDTENKEKIAPTAGTGWTLGDWWLYSFETPEYGEDNARIVVSEAIDDERNWMLGIASEKEAQRHAVTNHNPFLGRISMDQLMVYENGIPQPVFPEIWRTDFQWEFTLLGEKWIALVDTTNEFQSSVSATSSSQSKLNYVFSHEFEFLLNFKWETSTETKLTMTLTKSGPRYIGETWFIRGVDLKDDTWTGLDGTIEDTFFDSGHPEDGDFDYLLWYIDASIDAGGQGTLSVSDRLGASPLIRTWGSNSRESGGVGTIDSITGEYTLSVTLSGSTSYLHLKLAGGVETKWTLI